MALDRDQSQLLGEIKSDTAHIRELLVIQNGRIKKLEDKVSKLEAVKHYAYGVIVAASVSIGLFFNMIKTKLAAFFLGA